MKIKTTEIEIECTAEELRQSNSLSDGFYNVLRKALNGGCSIENEEIMQEQDNMTGSMNL